MTILFCDYNIIEINNTRNKKLLCFIPVRYNSSRLPGKPLLKFGNKSMIQLLYEKIKEVDEIDKIILLTDNVKIKEHVELFGAECHIIDEDCNSGTERIAHYLNKFQNSYKYILNVQGDEPFINIENVRSCIKDYENLNHNSDIKCFCLHSTCDSDHEISNKKFVKLILNKKNNVVYMSRQNVPTEFINLGSAFILEKKFLLEEFLNSHSPLQINEDIEWNNILDSGYKIHSTFVATHERSVDTQEDYDYLLKKYNYAN